MALQRRTIVPGTFGQAAPSGNQEKEDKKPAAKTPPVTPTKGQEPQESTQDPSSTPDARDLSVVEAPAKVEAPKRRDLDAESLPDLDTLQQPIDDVPPANHGLPGLKMTPLSDYRESALSGDKVVGEPDGDADAAPALSWARAAVNDSHWSAKRRPREWGQAPVRISVELRARIENRRVKDIEKRGEDLALIYYINAALANVPKNPQIAAKWAQEYLDQLPLAAPSAEGTTSRLQLKVAQRFKGISINMRSISRYGLVGHLQSAAVKRLLDALDEDDLGIPNLDTSGLNNVTGAQ